MTREQDPPSRRAAVAEVRRLARRPTVRGVRRLAAIMHDQQADASSLTHLVAVA